MKATLSRLACSCDDNNTVANRGELIATMQEKQIERESNVAYVRAHNKQYLNEISKIFLTFQFFMPIIISYFSYLCTPLWFVLLLYFRIVHPDFVLFRFLFDVHISRCNRWRASHKWWWSFDWVYYSILWACEWFSFALFEFCGHVNNVWQSNNSTLTHTLSSNSEGIYNHKFNGHCWMASVDFMLFSCVAAVSRSFFSSFFSHLLFFRALHLPCASTWWATVKLSKIT